MKRILSLFAVFVLFFLSVACSSLFYQPFSCDKDSDCEQQYPTAKPLVCLNNKCQCPESKGYRTCTTPVDKGKEGEPGGLVCVNTTNNNSHCGVCGNDCTRNNKQCLEGICCKQEETNCNNSCVQTNSNSSHCGACGVSCNEQEACCNGNCLNTKADDSNNCGACGITCKAGETCCAGVCVDPKASRRHCGACGVTCKEKEECCNGRCINTQSDTNSCGDCNTKCGRQDACCDGACINPKTALNHCGACGVLCKGGEQCCNGSCTDTQSDKNHCGACGRTCSEGSVCCDGKCTNPSTAINHCGVCGKLCKAGETCCDGNCVDVQSSNSHCGVCGNNCKGKGGTCCNGTCEDTMSDSAHCGGCGKACLSAANTCKTGQCLCPDDGVLCAGACLPTGSDCVDTVAGDGTRGFKDGPAEQAQFASPAGMVADKNGTIYVVDSGNHSIRMLQPVPNSSPMKFTVSTIAGTGIKGYKDGPGLQAQFSSPKDVALDGNGNLYVTDTINNRIRVLRPVPNTNPTRYEVETFAGSGISGFAGGPALQARFQYPSGVAVDGKGNVFVSVPNSRRIWAIRPTANTSPKQYTVSVFAGSRGGFLDGPALQAQFSSPRGLAMDAKGTLYVTDGTSHSVRGVQADALRPNVYSVFTLAGSGSTGFRDGTGAQALFLYPGAIEVNTDGHLFVAQKDRVRLVQSIPNTSPLRYSVSTIAGGKVGYQDGLAQQARFNGISGFAFGANGSLYMADGANRRVRRLRRACPLGQAYCNGKCVSLATDKSHCGRCGNVCLNNTSCVRGLCLCSRGQACVVSLAGNGKSDYVDGPAFGASFSGLSGIIVDHLSNVYVTDSAASSLRVIRPNSNKFPSQFPVETFSGIGAGGFRDGPSKQAAFHTPHGMAIDAKGNIFVADSANSRVRVIRPIPNTDPQQYKVETFAGSKVSGFSSGYRDGPAEQARFFSVSDVAVDTKGNVYVADRRNHRIRVVRPVTNSSPTKYTVSTLAGDGTAGYKDGPAAQAQFRTATRIAVDGKGNVYIADSGNHRIRMIRPVSNTSPVQYTVSTFAGSGSSGFKDGPALQAQFRSPSDVAVDAKGNVYVAERTGQRVRIIRPVPNTSPIQYTVSTLAGDGKAGYKDGPALQAQFDSISGLDVDAAGEVIFIADKDNGRVRVLFQCGTGKDICGLSCVNLKTDSAHCGNCNATCRSGQICNNGVCQ